MWKKNESPTEYSNYRPFRMTSGGKASRETKIGHLAFLNLEKDFDLVLHAVMWCALQEHDIVEELVE